MLTDQIQNDLKQAQLARDEVKVSTLRLLISEIKNAEIALRQNSGQANISDEQAIAVVQKEVKKRKEAAAGFRSGGREEQAQKEETEAKVLEGYLPTQLSTEELTKIVENTINELGATSLSEMGKVMSAVMSKVTGRADGGAVSILVKDRLTK